MISINNNTLVKYNIKQTQKMTNFLNTLLSNNNSFDYSIIISGGIILSCTLFYIIRSKYTAIPSKNTNALTNQETEAIVNENAVTKIDNKNIDAIIDNDSDTDTDTDVDTQSTSDNESLLDSATSSDFENMLEDAEVFFTPESILEHLHNTEKFIMPDVDFNVCPIEELKLFELCSIFSKELAEHDVSVEELIELISLFSKADLATNWVNDVILFIINLL